MNIEEVVIKEVFKKAVGSVDTDAVAQKIAPAIQKHIENQIKDMLNDFDYYDIFEDRDVRAAFKEVLLKAFKAVK